MVLESYLVTAQHTFIEWPMTLFLIRLWILSCWNSLIRVLNLLILIVYSEKMSYRNITDFTDFINSSDFLTKRVHIFEQTNKKDVDYSKEMEKCISDCIRTYVMYLSQISSYTE